MRYLEPTRTDRVMNRVVARLTRMGVSLWGSRILYVRGRTSGAWRTTPVNLLTHDGRHSSSPPEARRSGCATCAPRVAGAACRAADRALRATLADRAKPPVLRAYLDRWGWEVGRFFEGVSESVDDAGLTDIAPGFPNLRPRRGLMRSRRPDGSPRFGGVRRARSGDDHEEEE